MKCGIVLMVVHFMTRLLKIPQSHPCSGFLTKNKPFLSPFCLHFPTKGSCYTTHHPRGCNHVVLMQDTLSKMTLLRFLAIKLAEPHPVETLYWAQNDHF